MILATFCESIDQFVLVYLDILICSWTQEVTINIATSPPQARTLRQTRTLILIKPQQNFRYVVSLNSITKDENKVTRIWASQASTHMTFVWSFLDFTNFYLMFIRDYSIIVRPTFICKNHPFLWGFETKLAFETRQPPPQFLSSFILNQPNPLLWKKMHQTLPLAPSYPSMTIMVSSTHQVYSQKFTPPEIS